MFLNQKNICGACLILMKNLSVFQFVYFDLVVVMVVIVEIKICLI